jgi:hypothetical protein
MFAAPSSSSTNGTCPLCDAVNSAVAQFGIV